MTVTDVVDVSAETGLADPVFDELLAEGREQGYLTGDRIADALQEVDLAPDQIESLWLALGDEGIEIMEGDAPRDDGDTGPEQGDRPSSTFPLRRSAATRYACSSLRSARYRC